MANGALLSSTRVADPAENADTTDSTHMLRIADLVRTSWDAGRLSPPVCDVSARATPHEKVRGPEDPIEVSGLATPTATVHPPDPLPGSAGASVFSVGANGGSNTRASLDDYNDHANAESGNGDVGNLRAVTGDGTAVAVFSSEAPATSGASSVMTSRLASDSDAPLSSSPAPTEAADELNLIYDAELNCWYKLPTPSAHLESGCLAVSTVDISGVGKPQHYFLLRSLIAFVSTMRLVSLQTRKFTKEEI